MRIGVIGDTHLGSTDYSRKRRTDFSAAFVNAIEACRDRKAEVICLLGDVFDSAATGRNIDAFADQRFPRAVPRRGQRCGGQD